MPQLIAMIIIVVGAMIYMFQTFGGTGDKIETLAQKTSAIAEINIIKTGLKLAARGEAIKEDMTLKDLAGYFPEQIKAQLETSETDTSYNVISFGGSADQGANAAMKISLVAPKKGLVPGIFVEFTENGLLKDSVSFLETQIATDLKRNAVLFRSATEVDDGADVAQNPSGTALERRIPRVGTLKAGTGGTTGNPAIYEDIKNLEDGKFIIYFNDYGPNEVVVD